MLAMEDWNHFRAWLIASIAGIYSLFPLLFHAAGAYKESRLMAEYANADHGILNGT